MFVGKGFNTNYFLLVLSFSCLFGTFLYNSEYQRVKEVSVGLVLIYVVV